MGEPLALEALRQGATGVGFREGRDWLLSPEPLRLEAGLWGKMERMGHPLRMFQQAGEQVYRRSVNGSLPGWIAELLDAGKPAWMVEAQREEGMRMVAPRVIRPDLLLREGEFAVSELDSVPGGIGLTGWLSEIYGAAGWEVAGGAGGMLEGFRSLLPKGGEILVSEESADYRQEMDWLAERLSAGSDLSWRIGSAENYEGGEEAVYRFFELFDWENIPALRSMAGRKDVTPPIKPLYEEKLWLSLLHSPALGPVWEQEMRGAHLQRLRELVPYGWVVDPAPLPPHAALPRLEVGSWKQVARFSQKQRRLALKVSGFSEQAWGSRGVVIGHDVSGEEWAAALERACGDFDTQPWVMQEFCEAKVIEHPYYDAETGEVRTMEGRVRLCPYFFVDGGGKTKMGGCLASIVPADKKKIHGMRDAILVPVVRGE
ncbi:MAG: hypothetical protein OSA48_05795 [Akkermansiaceae bacterium]|nr:hypothetical protein [Akkermansiaceae bacterium]